MAKPIIAYRVLHENRADDFLVGLFGKWWYELLGYKTQRIIISGWNMFPH